MKPLVFKLLMLFVGAAYVGAFMALINASPAHSSTVSLAGIGQLSSSSVVHVAPTPLVPMDPTPTPTPLLR
jgi:hypothetical protein